MQGTKIFIGSLGNRAHPGDLRRLFEDYGTVTACDIVNRCGFVHMETEEQAKRAIQKLDKSTFNGQTISVEWGRQRQQGGDRGSGRSFGERRGRSNYDSDSRRRTSHRSRSRSRSRSPRRHRKHSEDSRGRGRSDSRRDRDDSDRRRSDRDRERDRDRDRSRNRSPERRRSYDKRR